MPIDRQETFDQMARGVAFETAAQTQAPMQFGRQEAIEAGTYRAEEDPQYWEHLGVAMDFQTPEAQEAVWRKYGEGLPHRSFEEFQQQAFTPAEDTPMYHEMRQIRAKTDHMIGTELPHAARMLEIDEQAAQYELDSIEMDLELMSETFEDRVQQIQAETEHAFLTNEAMEMQNEFQEWQQQLEIEELTPRQLREYDLELAGLEQRVLQDERLAPLERDLMAAQVDGQRAQTRTQLAQATMQELEADQMKELARSGLLQEALFPTGPEEGLDDSFTPEDFTATDFDRAMLGLQSGAGMEYIREYLGDYADTRGGSELSPEQFIDAITGPEGYVQDPERGTLWFPPHYMQDIATGQIDPAEVLVHEDDLWQYFDTETEDENDTEAVEKRLRDDYGL